MLYTEEQVETILTNPKNLVNQFEKNISSSTLEVKDKEYSSRGISRTTEERVLIGTIARAGLGTVQEVADAFGVGHESVENYKMGRTTRVSEPLYKPHPELEERIVKNLDIVQERAVDVLLRSLGVITDEKLAKASAKDASSIAANASKIVQNCAPQIAQDNRIQVIMYAPKQKELKDYQTVEI